MRVRVRTSDGKNIMIFWGQVSYSCEIRNDGALESCLDAENVADMSVQRTLIY